MRQVAEWQHNKTTIQRQLRIISQICEYPVVEGGVHEDSIYYSIENNTWRSGTCNVRRNG